MTIYSLTVTNSQTYNYSQKNAPVSWRRAAHNFITSFYYKTSLFVEDKGEVPAAYNCQR